MGLTIHFKGSFRVRVSLKEMIDEVKDTAEIQNWKYSVFENEFPANSLDKKDFDQNIYGINFTPPDCETVSLCFFSNGKMANPAMYRYWLKTKDKRVEQLIYGNFTKTQYAGIEIHKLIIHLLKYISAKYLKGFKLFDEWHYWETLDEKILEENFREYNFLIDSFKSSFENYPIKSGENIETYLLRLLKQIHEKYKK